jgi:Mg2+ and Co2+ transporter CorA
MSEFPEYQRWIAAVNRMNEGILFIATLAFIAVVWAVNIRAFAPRRLSHFLIIGVLLFYLSLMVVLWLSS